MGNTLKLYKCCDCLQPRTKLEMTNQHGNFFGNYSSCRYCVFNRYVNKRATENIRLMFGLKCDEFSEDLFEIVRLIFQIRYVLRTGIKKYIITKNYEKMTTQVNNSSDLRKALNENLHAILTNKRKLIVAKEVNNTLGKILSDVKMELMHNALTGNRTEISWFSSQKQLKSA